MTSSQLRGFSDLTLGDKIANNCNEFLIITSSYFLTLRLYRVRLFMLTDYLLFPMQYHFFCTEPVVGSLMIIEMPGWHGLKYTAYCSPIYLCRLLSATRSCSLHTYPENIQHKDVNRRIVNN